jgi:hypothetical protein
LGLQRASPVKIATLVGLVLYLVGSHAFAATDEDDKASSISTGIDFRLFDASVGDRYLSERTTGLLNEDFVVADNHCPSGSQWDPQSGQCMRPAPAPPPPRCPSGYQWHAQSGQCLRPAPAPPPSCTGGRVWRAGRCMCPGGGRWNPKEQRCYGGHEGRPPRGGG